MLFPFIEPPGISLQYPLDPFHAAHRRLVVLRIKPFAALRPADTPSGTAEAVASVPYDVVNTQEARALAEGNPSSFLHVVRPDIDLPDDTDPYAPEVYRTAADAMQRLRSEGVLIQDAEPALYLYRQQAVINGQSLSQTGVVACCHVDDYLNDRIRKHEKTRQAKEDDRTRHVLTLNANTGPVFLLHEDRPAIAALTKSSEETEALYDFTAVDGVRHTVWRIDDPAPFVEAFGQLDVAYVADGHHRSASAARAGAERRAGNPGHNGDEEYNWFLTVLFPASALTVLPYNRIVRDLNGLAASDFLSRISEVCEVVPDAPAEPDAPGRCAMHIEGRWYGLTFPPPTDPANPVATLDYERLYQHILAPILGIGDIRSDERIDFVGGIRGTAELEKHVAEGSAAVAFSMHPTTIEQLMAVSDAGLIMPPKSTWFEPKLRSGLLVHLLD